jgi:Sec-independent protein translocase protein TatA
MKDGSTIRILFTVSNLAFILAAIFLLITIVLFIRFKIPSVMDDLSGRTARRSIKEIREKNEMETELLTDPYETETLDKIIY